MRKKRKRKTLGTGVEGESKPVCIKRTVSWVSWAGAFFWMKRGGADKLKEGGLEDGGGDGEE